MAGWTFDTQGDRVRRIALAVAEHAVSLERVVATPPLSRPLLIGGDPTPGGDRA